MLSFIAVLRDTDTKLPTKHLQALALPKTTSSEHMRYLVAQIEKYAPKHKYQGQEQGLRVIAMIENARGMMNLKEIIEAGQGYIDGLLVSLYLSPDRIDHDPLRCSSPPFCCSIKRIQIGPSGRRRSIEHPSSPPDSRRAWFTLTTNSICLSLPLGVC